MHKSDYYTASAFIGTGIVFLVGSLRLGLSAPTSDGIPGSGFFPFILSVLVIALGAALLVKAALFRGDKKASFALDEEQKDNAKNWLVTVAAILAMLGMWRFGSQVDSLRDYAFEIAVFIFTLFLNRFLKRSWLFTIFFSAAIVLLIHLLFVQVLYISFEI